MVLISFASFASENKTMDHPELLHFSCILAEISTKPENHFSNDQSFAYLNCTVMPEPISAAHMKNDTQPL